MGLDRDPADTNPYAEQTAANTDAPWVGDGTPVDVDLEGLREYAKHMADQQRDLMGRSMHLNHLFQMPVEAWDGAVLGEAAFVRSQLTANANELSTYLQQLGQAMMNIGSAAQTVADSYQSADGTSAASLNAVLFAYGDKSVPRPAGLRSDVGQTYSEAVLAAGSTTPTAEDSPDWGPSTETVVSPYQTARTSVAPNGQVREVVTTTVPGSNLTVVTTTVYGAGGKVLSSSSTRTTSSYDTATNTQRTTVESSRNGTRTGSSQTTTTYTGAEVSRRETVTYVAGKDGADHRTTTQTETVGSDGVRTETTKRPGKDGAPDEVTDRVVVGPETEGRTSPQDPIARAYDPLAPGTN